MIPIANVKMGATKATWQSLTNEAPCLEYISIEIDQGV